MATKQYALRCLLAAALVFGSAACENAQGPLGPELSSVTDGEVVLGKGVKSGGKKKDGGEEPVSDYDEAWASRSKKTLLEVTDAWFYIPRHSVSEPTLITMQRLGSVEGSLWAYEFTPTGTVFNKHATLKIQVTQEFLEANNISPGKLRIAEVTGPDPSTWKYMDGRYDPGYGVIQTEIDHFSRYALCVE